MQKLRVKSLIMGTIPKSDNSFLDAFEITFSRNIKGYHIICFTRIIRNILNYKKLAVLKQPVSL